MKIRLIGNKLKIAIIKGVERFNESRKMDLDPNIRSGIHSKKDIKIRDIQGSIAEMAVAEMLGIENFQPTVNNFAYIKNSKAKKDPDIEPNVEVRSVQHNKNFPNKKKSLILRTHEAIHKGIPIEDFWKRKFYLAVVEYEDMKEQLQKEYIDVDIKGYLIGEDGLKKEYIYNPNQKERNARPAYFVPIEKLIS